MPCEVRFVRLPSSTRRLIRASITDITERKRAEDIAAGERRVFEQIAANAPLGVVLETICEAVESVLTQRFCAIDLSETEDPVASLEDSANLSREAVSAYEHARECVGTTPIVTLDGRSVGTLSVHQRQPGSLPPRDAELLSRMAQIAGIAVDRRRADDALRASEVKFRGLFESVMEGVYRTRRDGRFLDVNPAFVQMLGYASAEDLCRVPAAALYWYPSDREMYVRRVEAQGVVRKRRIGAASQGRFDARGRGQRAGGARQARPHRRL